MLSGPLDLATDASAQPTARRGCAAATCPSRIFLRSLKGAPSVVRHDVEWSWPEKYFLVTRERYSDSQEAYAGAEIAAGFSWNVAAFPEPKDHVRFGYHKGGGS